MLDRQGLNTHILHTYFAKKFTLAILGAQNLANKLYKTICLVVTQAQYKIGIFRVRLRRDRQIRVRLGLVHIIEVSLCIA